MLRRLLRLGRRRPVPGAAEAERRPTGARPAGGADRWLSSSTLIRKLRINLVHDGILLLVITDVNNPLIHDVQSKPWARLLHAAALPIRTGTWAPAAWPRPSSSGSSGAATTGIVGIGSVGEVRGGGKGEAGMVLGG